MDLDSEDEEKLFVEPQMPSETNFNHIKNKIVRGSKGLQLKKEKKAKKIARIQRRKEGIEPQKPHTIESLREKDETMIDNLENDKHEEVNKYLFIFQTKTKSHTNSYMYTFFNCRRKKIWKLTK